MFIHGGVAILAQESEIAASLEYPASIIGALIGSRGAKINEDRGGPWATSEACGGFHPVKGGYPQIIQVRTILYHCNPWFWGSSF